MFCTLALVLWQLLVSPAGDVITGINGRKVTKAADLAIALDDFKVGDKVTLKVRRGEEGSQVSNPASTSCCLICVLAREDAPHMLPMPAMVDAHDTRSWLNIRNIGCYAARPCMHLLPAAQFMLVMEAWWEFAYDKCNTVRQLKMLSRWEGGMFDWLCCQEK